jgi:hypothetical protein
MGASFRAFVQIAWACRGCHRRGLSREQCVLPCLVESPQGARVTHPISAESRRGDISARPWMGASFGVRVQIV